MDRVRLGRALGYGARHAARTVSGVVDAAMAPGPAKAGRSATPSASGSAASAPAAAAPRPAASAAAATVASQRQKVYRNVAGATIHARSFGRSVWSPLKAFSSAVFLQVVGTFFLIFAAFMGNGVWRLRAAFKSPASPHQAHELYVSLAAFLIFSYFSASSFARANRIGRASPPPRI